MNITPDIFFYIGLGLVVIELFVGVDTGFDLVLLGASFLLGGTAFFASESFWLGIIVTTITAFAYLLFGRKALKEKLLHQNKKTNVDRLVGAEGVVVKNISPHQPGQVKIEGEVWRAESKGTIREKEKVVVESFAGVTLKVNKEKK